MPDPVQSKLLRFLQDRTFLAIGSTKQRRANVRILAATQHPRRGLRPDIIGRFGAEAFKIPPLRRREGDIGALCVYLLRELQRDTSSFPTRFDPEAFRSLCAYRWPYNVRELRAALLRAGTAAADRRDTHIRLGDLPERILAATGHAIEATPDDGDLPDEPAVQLSPGGRPDVATSASRAPRRSPRPRPTREQLKTLLVEHDGNAPSVARSLGCYREQVWRWCREYGINPRESG
jgi:transcriptional regulator with PAS, ATPase and Fis domain